MTKDSIDMCACTQADHDRLVAENSRLTAENSRLTAENNRLTAELAPTRVPRQDAKPVTYRLASFSKGFDRNR